MGTMKVGELPGWAEYAKEIAGVLKPGELEKLAACRLWLRDGIDPAEWASKDDRRNLELLVLVRRGQEVAAKDPAIARELWRYNRRHGHDAEGGGYRLLEHAPGAPEGR